MKKFVAFLLILIICIPLFSCTLLINRHALALAAEKQETSYTDFQDEEYKAFIAKIQAFSARLTAEMVNKHGQSENFAISPISVYMALSLACECAVGETRQEILDAVGVTYNEVNKYTSKLYAYANEEYLQYNVIADGKQTVAYQMLNNSIWLDDSVEFVEDGVNKLANNYNCDVFQASVKNGEMARLIGGYIRDKSKGLLDGKVELSPETYFVLMNTYYLKEIWNEYGRNLSFAEETYNFIGGDGSETATKLLQGYYNDGKVYKGAGYSSFFTSTEHGFRIYFFLPDDDWSVNSIFTEENIYDSQSSFCSFTDGIFTHWRGTHRPF